MCGIVHVKRATGVPANKAVIKRFNNQRKRGTQGFGYVAIKDGVVVSVERSMTEGGITEKLLKEDANEILFHHRQPTSTPNYVGATHPIIVSDDLFEYDYALIHNGVIINSDSLKIEHESYGFRYSTQYILEKITKTEVTETLTFNNGFVEKDTDTRCHETTEDDDGYNDSEALAYEIAMVCEGWKERVTTTGAMAFIVLQIEKGENGNIIGNNVNKMFYGSNFGRPLILEVQKNKKNKKGKKKKNKNNATDGNLIALKSEGHGNEIEKNILFSVQYDDDNAVVEKHGEKFNKHYTEPKTHDVHNVHANYRGTNVGFNHQKKTEERVGGGIYNVADDSTTYHNRTERLANGYTFDEIEDNSHDYYDNSYDDTITEVEYDLATELEVKESESWSLKAHDLVAEISDLINYISELEYSLKLDNKNTEKQIELVAYKEEYDRKQNELLEVQDRLIELDLPIPSQIPSLFRTN